MLIEGDDFSEGRWRQSSEQKSVRWAVACECFVRHEHVGDFFGPHFIGGLSKSERLGLCEYVCHEQVVMRSKRIERLAEAEEIAGDQARALMNKLIEGVLTVGAGLAPIAGA